MPGDDKRPASWLGDSLLPPDGPLRDEMRIRLHTTRPPLTFVRRLDADHTPTIVDGQCVEVVTPGHRCWAFHNPGVWPWVARCVLDVAHTTNTFRKDYHVPHKDSDGRTWTD